MTPFPPVTDEEAACLAVIGPGRWVPFKETVKGNNGYDWTVMGHRWEPDGPGNKILTEVEFTEVEVDAADLKNNQDLSDGGR